MKDKYISILIISILVFSNAYSLRADLKLPAIISDNMVLQQNTDAVLWGWANANEEIAVTPSWSNKQIKVKAGADGKWLAKIKTINAGGPYKLTFKANNVISLNNVYLGEVWFCSGQSNMEMKVARTLNADSVSRAATSPLIRMFTVQRASAETQQDNVVGSWVINSSTSVRDFSAVAYYFGSELAAKLKVPIGLIHSSWSGTPAESWVDRTVLKSEEIFRPILSRYDERLKEYEKVKQGVGNKKMEDPKLRGPVVLFNAMVKPLVNYRIKGVIWYQGENNSTRAYQYRKLFPALIQNWRDEFKMPDLPFYFVQITPYKAQNPEIREAQLMTLKNTKLVGMVVTTDVGDCNDVHAKNKEPVGKRLAYIALHKSYNQKQIQYLSPIYNRYEILESEVKIFFDSESNLIAKNGALREFTIAGADQFFYPAIAKIEGKTVIVSSTQVKKPVAVRFGWQNCPDSNLFNEEGLPASPFRTDDWKGITEGKY